MQAFAHTLIPTAKIVQGERRAKEKLVFSFYPEPKPILGEAKVVQGE